MLDANPSPISDLILLTRVVLIHSTPSHSIPPVTLHFQYIPNIPKLHHISINSSHFHYLFIMQHRKAIKSHSTLPHDQTHTTNNTNPKQLKFILISMALLISLTLLSLLLFFSLSSSSSSHHHQNPNPNSDNNNNNQSSSSIIQNACKSSRDPHACQLSLIHSNHVPPNPTAPDIIQAALFISSDNLIKGRSMAQNLLTEFNGNKNGTDAVNNCLELLRYSEYRTNLVRDALARAEIKNARAWMSGALVYQYDCWSALKYVNTSLSVAKTMSFFNNSLIGSSSDVLSMMVNYDFYGEKTGSWGPVKTERDGFWESGLSGGGGSGLSGGVGVLKADVTVCKGGGCDYGSVQEAVNGAPDNAGKRFVIWIKSGVYEETVRVGLEKRNVVFLGDGMGKTVITGSMNVGQQGMTTYNSATVGVVGDGFMATGLTIQNTAGPEAHQAVAFRSDSDLSIIENCEFLGNQDTLYAHSLRQYYKSCRIQGNVDFIFGNSAAFFQDCLILVAPRQIKPEKGENNAVTAHGRIDPAQSTGFVFQNCVINGTDAYMALYYSKPKVHKNYLGRPWKQYSRTVFIRCTLEALVTPTGWLPWSGNFALDTLYYGEFENTGAGSDVSGRVSWSSRVPAEHVGSYSVQNFIQGDQWISTSS